MRPHRGTLILVLGILSIVVCGPLGIVAWVMGNADIKDMDAGLMDPSGRDITNTGRIIGMIVSILMIAGFVMLIGIFLIMTLFAVGASAAGAG